MHINSLGFAKDNSATRVVVAMSGGVDSSVVAALLKSQNYEVIGITLQLYDQNNIAPRPGSCCAGRDIEDARQVCDKFNIPYYVLNYERRFQEAVIEPFAQSYLDGETPVPCVSCNQTVKFADLLSTAKELGADCLATGHYIRSQLRDDKRELCCAVDSERDQSYFLFATTQEQIDYLRFPLGGFTKDKVRDLAQQFGLKVADKPDSQDICFVSRGKYFDFIEKLHPSANQEGDIIHIDGRHLGRHKGIIHYTIGQRRGLGIALGEPLYVIYIDKARNEVILGPHHALASNKIILRDVNWLGRASPFAWPRDGLEIFAKIRSTRPAKAASLYYQSYQQGALAPQFAGGGQFIVEFKEPEYSISPGQACVFYDRIGADAQLLGGGFIKEVSLNKELAQLLAARQAL